MHNSPAQSVPPRFGRRWIGWTAGALGLALIACTTLIALYPDTDWAVSETGPMETFHNIMWGVAIILAAIALAKLRDRTTRLMDFWLLLLASGALARELDLHMLLKPDGALGAFGMRYRIDWWLSAEVPVWLKLAWLIANIALVACLALPPLLVKAPMFRLLRAGDGASWTFLISVGFLGTGYAADDLLGRGQIIEPLYSRWIEETSEGLGAVAFAVSAAISLLNPLGARIAFVSDQAQPAAA